MSDASVVCYDHLELTLTAQEVLKVIMGCSNGAKKMEPKDGVKELTISSALES